MFDKLPSRTVLAAEADAPERTWRWPELRRGPAVGLLVLFVGVAVAQGSAYHAFLQARGSPTDLDTWLIGHITGAIGAWAAIPAVQTAVLNAEPARGWPRVLAVHVAGYLAFAAQHVALMLTLRWVAGLFAPHLSFGSPGSQLLFEARADLVVYPAIAGLWYALRMWNERRAAALRAARLERAVALARLDALTARLDPHFLFNALNTLGEVMHRDLERAEALLADLGELLRVALGPGAPTWTLADERAYTERYALLLAARFEDRVRILWSTSASPALALPRFAVQSLVENSVKHNQHRQAPLTVSVDVVCRDGLLEIRVADDGCGFPDPAPTEPRRDAPRGLARLAETLTLLYGASAALTRGRSALGGAEVRLTLPAEAPP